MKQETVEMLKALDAEQAQLQANMFGPGGGQVDILANSAAYRAIVDILHAKPIMVTPCLRWLNQKLAGISMAELRQLYTEEEINEMQAKLDG